MERDCLKTQRIECSPVGKKNFVRAKGSSSFPLPEPQVPLCHPCREWE